MNVALLTAAGTGNRMHMDIPKQFYHINNKPIILYTLEAFQTSSLIDEILVVTLPNWKDVLWAYAKQYNINKLKYVVDGGETGQESIKLGLEKLKNHISLDDVVMVHDGNRPMVSSEVIADSISTYKKRGSAVAAIPCIEAIFKSDNGVSSNISIPREELYRTQTPHTYQLKDMLWAHEIAEEKGIKNTTATCVLMQMLGKEIYFSKGSEKNLKITTSEDIETFEAYLNQSKG